MNGRRHVWPKGAGTCVRKGCGRRRRRGAFQAWVFQDGTRGEFEGTEGTCKGEELPTVTVMGVTVQQDPEKPEPRAVPSEHSWPRDNRRGPVSCERAGCPWTREVIRYGPRAGVWYRSGPDVRSRKSPGKCGPLDPVGETLADAALGSQGLLHVSTAGVRHVPASEVFRNPVEEALAAHGFHPVDLPGGVRGYSRPCASPTSRGPFVVVAAGAAREVRTMESPVDVLHGDTIRLPFPSVTALVDFLTAPTGEGER